jgi:hypothetical protein
MLVTCRQHRVQSWQCLALLVWAPFEYENQALVFQPRCTWAALALLHIVIILINTDSAT